MPAAVAAAFPKMPLTGFLSQGPGGRILEVNEHGLEMSGYSREEFLGLAIVDLVVPQHTGRLPAIIARLKSGQPEIVESSLLRMDGSRLAD